MDKRFLKIGWAHTDITPERPILMEGQMYMRYSGYIHDPVTATALALVSGSEQLIMVSMDMTEVPMHAMPLIEKELYEKNKEIEFRKISFNVTHTHTSSSFYGDCMREDNEKVFSPDILPRVDIPESAYTKEESQRFFVTKIVGLILEAWKDLKPGGVSFAQADAEIAYNRRPQFLIDGKPETIMYGDCTEDSFVGFESGTDTSLELMYTWDPSGKLMGVVCNVPCPSQVYELHYFISSDYWGNVRKKIKERIGENVYVLPLCGAAGDLCPIDLLKISGDNKEELRIWREQQQEVQRNFDEEALCEEIADKIVSRVEECLDKDDGRKNYDPVFRHEIIRLKLPIRQISEEDYRKSAAEVEELHRRFSYENPMNMAELVKAFEPQGDVLRYRQQIENPWFEADYHIVRIGDAAIATNPFELYHEYASRIKEAAKSKYTFIVQLANGIGCYLPTEAAIKGGSYSSRPASTVCGAESGEELVRKTVETINKMWKPQKGAPMNNKVGYVCFGEVNTPIEKLNEKHDATLALLKERFTDWDILDAGLVIDDTEYKYADAAIAKLKAGEFDCLLTVVCGWIPTHAVIRVTDNWRHLPILLWGLCGWKENGRIVTTAEQAGTTAIRPAYEALGYNFKYIYNVIGKDQPLDKVDAFVRAAHARAMLRKTHVGSMGYRDMFLYGTCFEAQSMRSQIGPEVECFEMLEMVQNMEKLEQQDIDEGVRFVKENWVFKKECPEETIVNGVKYALAIAKKINERGYEAVSLLDVDGMKKLLGFPPAMVFMLLEHYCNVLTIPENDVMGAVTQLMMKYITGQIVPYLEYYEFFDKSVLAGVPDFIPKAATDGDVTVLPAAFGLLATSLLNVSKCRTGYVTCVRLIYMNGRYKLHMYTGQAQTPPAWNEYGWDDPAPQLPSLEIFPDNCTVEEFAQKVSCQHVIVAFGDYSEAVKDFCKMMDIELI